MKKIIISLCVFLVLAVAAILVVPGLVDWNEYKQQVAARVGAVIGLDVAIDGDMDFAVLPTPHLSASGVRIVSNSSTTSCGHHPAWRTAGSTRAACRKSRVSNSYRKPRRLRLQPLRQESSRTLDSLHSSTVSVGRPIGRA